MPQATDKVGGHPGPPGRVGDTLVYPGRDLEAMAFAEKYHRWILQDFKPYMGARLVEVGAGTGSFSELLRELRPESLTLVEPSAEMHDRLRERVGGASRGVCVTTYNAFFRSVAGEIESTQRPDSIIYVNVLEHIADDEGELREVHRTLGPGGRVFIFVPAFQWLFGKFDERVGHVRRYTRAELERKCVAAGFRVLASRYFDLAGVVPWWLKYRLFKSDSLDARTVGLYDRFAVPLTRAAESLIKPPIGKNIILIAERV